jgi:hypothetical protein
VGIDRGGAVRPLEDRARHPQTGAVELVIQSGAGPHADVDPVARITLRRKGVLPRRRWEQLLSQVFVPCDTACRQHHALSSAHRGAPGGPFQHGAYDCAVLTHEVDESRIEPNRHLLLAQAVQETSHHGVPHHKVGAAAVP